MQQSNGPDMLRKAVDERSIATINFAVGRHAFSWHVRFAGAEDGQDAADGPGLWVRVLDGERTLLKDLARAAVPVELALAAADSKLFCDTVVLRARRWHLPYCTALLRRPERLCVVDRRQSLRESVPETFGLTGAALTETSWGSTVCARVIAGERLDMRGGGDADVPVRLVVWDLSETGACLMWPADSPLAQLRLGQRLRLILSRDGRGLTIPGTLRRIQRLSSQNFSAGVEFHDAPRSRDANELDLAAMVAELRDLRTRKTVCSVLRLDPRKLVE
jgi:hypothetical protein